MKKNNPSYLWPAWFLSSLSKEDRSKIEISILNKLTKGQNYLWDAVDICEDIDWKDYITNIFKEYSFKNSKTINIININYENPDNINNYNAVLDLFCLSKCKKIFQGAKISNYSNIAAIIGNNNLINYSHLLKLNNILYTHIYRPVININGKLEYDIDLIEKILLNIPFIDSNITGVYQ